MARRTLPSDLLRRRTASILSTLALSMTTAMGMDLPADLMVRMAVSRSMSQTFMSTRMPRSTSLAFFMCTLTMRLS